MLTDAIKGHDNDMHTSEAELEEEREGSIGR